MRKQRGAVTPGMAALVGVLCVLAAALAIGVGSYVSAYNYGNRMEQQLKAARDDNRNILAQYGQQVQEAAQVPSMYAEDVLEVTTAAIEGRYGERGSQAMFQWFQEQNPDLDASLYLQVQQIVEAGRANFENGQRRLIDVRRQYETQLGSLWGGLWLRIAGYPNVDLDEFGIVSTDRADAAFENLMEDGPIQLR